MKLFSSLDFDTEPHALRWALSFARGYLELGMFAAAEKELSRLSVRHRCYADVIELRVRVMIARKRFAPAAWLARSASKIYPGVAEFYVLASEAYEAMNRPEDAKAVWIAAPSLFHVSSVFHYNLARYEAQLGNHLSAREHITLAIELDPANQDRAESDPRLRAIVGGVQR
ncbi:hypothetical protein ASA1KI_02070 [Opitutales bacterium ASA1]|uniref:hypothetical protein n=1 Tax=Congregicoccus parvus TaxID=3081749 RepID=UPI002B2E0572|nr:hypothetical protein ASA1KI_02070 [Opitutales bacterium ASA1]